MRRITIVEDETSIAEMLRLNLELENFEVIVFNHGGEAFRNLPVLISSDLLILDVMLPEKTGFEILSEIRKTSQIPAIVLSAKGSTHDRIHGLKLGANDYLPKPFDLEELLLRIQNLLPEKKPIKQEIVIGSKQVNVETFEVKSKDTDEVTELTKREIELLQLFEEKSGLVVSREEILDRLWGEDVFPTSRTIDNYILAFRKIFEEDPKHPVYFHSIRGVGYKFTP
jgi:two-component system alkaline phosphatase synthesis response regulator PhoP|tara:strand:- start:638 stop:1315 length:678 start_codon:yes stop_codon:yes gene_type:complete